MAGLSGIGWLIKSAIGIDVSTIDFEGMAADLKAKAEALVALAQRVDERISRLELQQTRIENLLLELNANAGNRSIHDAGGRDSRGEIGLDGSIGERYRALPVIRSAEGGEHYPD